MPGLLQHSSDLLVSPSMPDGVSTMATLTGTAGNDDLVGTAGIDVFHMEDGGDDTVRGASSDDSFYFGASFTDKDHVSGDGGRDTLFLDGDYSAGVTFAGHTLTSVEVVALAAGHSYAFDTGAYANASLDINGSSLGAGESLHVDASSFTGGALSLRGGAGDDILVGHGNVTLSGGQGDNILTAAGSGTAWVTTGTGANTITTDGFSDTVIMSSVGLDDHIDAGSAGDSDTLRVGTAGSDLSADNIQNFELIYLMGGEVKVEDGFADGHNSTNFRTDTGAISLRFDGSAVLGEDLTVAGSSQSDTITGGAGDDHIDGNGGTNTLIGGAGEDTLTGDVLHDKLVGGTGADILVGGGASDSFVYLSLDDSRSGAVDEITDLTAVDVVDLKAIDADTKKAGNQAFHLVDDFTHHRGELMLSYDKETGRTEILGDVNGDGEADLVISADGKHLDFSNFVL